MITSLQLSTTLIYDVSRRWILYLNMCMDVSSLEASGDTAPFTLEPILLNPEGGQYVDPILPGDLSDLIVGRRGSGSRGGTDEAAEKSAHPGGAQRCGFAMTHTFPPFPFGTGRNFRP